MGRISGIDPKHEYKLEGLKDETVKRTIWNDPLVRILRSWPYLSYLKLKPILFHRSRRADAPSCSVAWVVERSGTI